MGTNPNATLLIIDDEGSVCRALARILRKKVGEVAIASTLADAMLVLDTKKVTHVLCDHLLGPGQPTGIDTASRWKMDYPSIEKLVILTGTNAVHDTPPAGIDQVLPKTIDPFRLADILGLS